MSELTVRFTNWLARGEGNPCPLTISELITLLDRPEPDPHETRRALLREARSALAREADRLSVDSALRARFNTWREELAVQYRDDIELPPWDRLRAALDALLVPVSNADDLRRPATLHIAGEIFARRAAIRMDREDLAKAASCFADAWRIERCPDASTSARRAVLLLMRLTKDDEPATGEIRQRELCELLEDVTRCAESWLESARDMAKAIDVNLGLPPAGGLSRAEAAWDAITQIAAEALRQTKAEELERRQEAYAGALDNAWTAALALLFAHVAGGDWKLAKSWTERLGERQSDFRLLHGHIPDLERRFAEILRETVEMVALRTPITASPIEATDLLVALLEPTMRDRLHDWFVSELTARQRPAPQGMSGEAEFDRWIKASEAASERARNFKISERDMAALAARLVVCNRSGPIGLALSGGGFRASFFHLGVLARLAELDLLRRVDVISTVSGGTIVGACYYLKLKGLLESKHDAHLTREDYISLVEALYDEFLEGVQTNIRTRIFANLSGLIRMWFVPGYTRTDRVADLIASELFARVADDPALPHIALSALRIVPFGEPPGFDPERDNWRRAARVPTLVINATSVNTGHNWQFTTGTAGEPVSAVDSEIDSTPRFRTFVYPLQLGDDGPAASSGITLASAVAASACVPGMFPPLEFADLYSETWVRLVDGGVFDNQGMSALIDHACEIIIASDGSGQIDFDPLPSSSIGSSLQRANDILMARVRQLQFRTLLARRSVGSLRHLAAVHLTKGLDVSPIGWRGFRDPDDLLVSARAFGKLFKSAESLLQGKILFHETRYGIAEKAQRLLARVRTDLDSFHQAEAYALSWCGYRMATCDLGEVSAAIQPVGNVEAHDWRMKRPWQTLESDWNMLLVPLLAASHHRFFKLARLAPKRTVLVVALAGSGVAFAGWSLWDGLVALLPAAALVFAALIGAAAAASLVLGLVFYRRVDRYGQACAEIFEQLVLGCLLPAAWIASHLHLALIDPLYLRRGRVDTVDGRPRPRRQSRNATISPAVRLKL